MATFKFSLLSVALILLSLCTNAQNTRLSLKEAWEKAYLSYPSLKEKQALIRASEYNTSKVKSEAIPSLQLQLQNTFGTFNGGGGAFFPVPGIFNISGNNSIEKTSTTGNAYGSVVADWEIFHFGKQKQNVSTANALTQKSKEDYALTKLSVKTVVTRLYFKIIYAQAYLNWAKSYAERVKKISEIAASLSDAGLKPGADTSLSHSSYLLALSATDEWNGNTIAAKTDFLEYLPMLTDSIVVNSDFFLKSGTPSKFIISESNHPALKILEQHIKVNQFKEKAMSADLLPSLSALAGVSSRGSGIGTTQIDHSLGGGFQNMNNNYLVGLGLTWNISNLYSGTLQKKQLQQEVIAAEARYDLQKLKLNTGIQSIENRITEQFKQVNKTDKAVTQAREAYDLYFSRYEAGLINLIELLQIQLLLEQSEKKNIEAHQAFWDQVISLAVASNDFSYLSNQF